MRYVAKPDILLLYEMSGVGGGGLQHQGGGGGDDECQAGSRAPEE